MKILERISKIEELLLRSHKILMGIESIRDLGEYERMICRDLVEEISDVIDVRDNFENLNN